MQQYPGVLQFAVLHVGDTCRLVLLGTTCFELSVSAHVSDFEALYLATEVVRVLSESHYIVSKTTPGHWLIEISLGSDLKADEFSHLSIGHPRLCPKCCHVCNRCSCAHKLKVDLTQ